ncbi:hypothetical protein Nhal_3320 [Nitrosococcus halophilus Nc 4]|uniref:O-antigen ligase-related domain-containing protein n=1 Tax=Nitrosococcus halophilus (strain Nc4) TaxID=472759 RepID=D5C0P0_NITHN|nr:O-antigen ligase family protein [Nitrosococcus halophilus]ADE16363.1 hypothetical protein Nhal_3320 [Nitrosococcus halophilus Nc 4]
MRYAYLLLIIAMANDLFDLVPWTHIPGVFNVSDVGIALIGLGILFYIFKVKDFSRLSNFFTWYIFLYLVLLLVQVSVASFNYSQSIFDGLIAARDQFYYLLFPLSLFALNDVRKIKKFLNILSIVSVILIFISIVNYFGPTLFYHRWADGHGVRSGIVRAYIPAMVILPFGAIWEFIKYLDEKKIFTHSLLMFLIIFSGILFRQSRIFILGVTVTLVLILIARRHFKVLVGFGLFSLILIILLEFTTDQNLLLNVFYTAYIDIAQEEGTWEGRLQQIRASFDIVLENFWTGSGGLVIRGSHIPGWASLGSLLDVALNTDLGYWTWVKFFGFPGIVLITILIIGFYLYAWKIKNLGGDPQIINFAWYYFTYVLLIMVTIGTLTITRGIVLLCIIWASLVNATQGEVQVQSTKYDSKELPVASNKEDR